MAPALADHLEQALGQEAGRPNVPVQPLCPRGPLSGGYQGKVRPHHCRGQQTAHGRGWGVPAVPGNLAGNRGQSQRGPQHGLGGGGRGLLVLYSKKPPRGPACSAGWESAQTCKPGFRADAVNRARACCMCSNSGTRRRPGLPCGSASTNRIAARWPRSNIFRAVAIGTTLPASLQPMEFPLPPFNAS